MLLWSLFLLPLAALPPQPSCPTPPEYSYTDWAFSSENRWYQDEWVMQQRHYSRTRTDECRGTSETESRTEGPFRLWQAVPDRRVADVNHPDGATEGLTGSPLRSSELPGFGQPAAVGPNPAPVQNRVPDSTPGGSQPAPAPFFPGVALLVGALVYGLVFRRRSRKSDPVAAHTEEPIQGPPVPAVPPRTFASLPEKGEWLPAATELAWLQAFFGIDEPDYGPLTQSKVKRLQEKYQIPPDGQVMIGPKTYRALWQEHLNLVHETWRKSADGDHPAALDRVLDSPLPPDLRAELTRLNDAYASYWSTVEGRYQAILRRDPVLVAEYDRELTLARGAGLKVDEIGVLQAEYQPLIDALNKQAETVKNTADDGEYAKLQAMLAAADAGKWEEIASTQITWGKRWKALTSGDRAEAKLGAGVVESLKEYVLPSVLGTMTTAEGASGVQPSGHDFAESPKNEGRWSWSKQPLKLGGTSPSENWLMEQITVLNDQKIPRAARFVVRNQRIVALKKAGTPPTVEVPLPPVTDPEVQSVIQKLRWDQVKIDKVWAKATEFGIDPRIMLAVVLHEGTGSFNTNAEVPTQWFQPKNPHYVAGGSGAQPDFKTDLDDALEAHILAKVRAYGHYGQEFKEAVMAAELGDGNVFQYANYNVPWFKKDGWSTTPGCYATDTQWWVSVKDKFDKLAGVGASAAYSDYLISHPLPVSTPRPPVTFARTNGGTGDTEEEQGRPWIEARP